jgi:hypothetical protein
MGAIIAAKTPLSTSALKSLHRHDDSVASVRNYLLPLASLLTSLENDKTPVKILYLQDFHTSPRSSESPTSQKLSLSEEVHSERLGLLSQVYISPNLHSSP